MPPRSSWPKRIAGRIVAPGLLLVLRLTRRRAGVVVLYHTVAERDGDPRSQIVPVVSVRRLRAHLDHLRRWYVIVPAVELLEAVRTRRRGERFPVAITFDDDAVSHATLAVAALGPSPATFFLNRADRSFWWQRLQRSYAGPDLHREALRWQKLPPDQLAIEEQSLPEVPVHRVDAQRLVAAGHAVGFHTRDHLELTALDDDALEHALSRSDSALIAYPFGMVDDRVAEAARAAGHSYGFTTEPVPVRPGSDPLRLGRLDAASETPAGLAAALVRTLLR